MNRSASPLSVAIVGGGITGLTAAFRLRERGIAVTVYESAGRVGGPIQSERIDGFLAEWGPNSILETSPKIAALIRDLGLEPRKWVSNPEANRNYIVRNGRPIALPSTPLAFMASPLFSLPAKLRLCLEPFLRTPAHSPDESLADFVLRRLGREFLDYAINPFVGGIYAGHPAKLSVKHAFPKLAAVEAQYGSLILGQFLGARERQRRQEVAKDKARKVSFDDGLQVLTDTLQAKLGESIRLHAPVTRLRQHAAGWSVTVATPNDEHGEVEHEHDAVLLTAPAFKLASMALESETQAGLPSLNLLGEIEHPPVARIVLGFRREDVADPLHGFGFLVPEIEPFNILGTTFSSSIFPGRAPEGHVTLTTFVGGERQPELARREPEALVALVVRDLEKLLGVRGKPVFHHHVLFPHAIPQYNVGYARFQERMDTLEARLSGLFFAGNYRNGVSLGNSIVAGQEIAERIATFQPSHTTAPSSSIAS
jgi:oxygen-dependent protoporphyrinogen oxidase